MITVSIIGILASIAIPKFADLIRKSKEGATKGNLGAIRGAVNVYYSDNEGTYPINLFALVGKYIAVIPALYLPYYHPDAPAGSGTGTGNCDIASCDEIGNSARALESPYSPNPPEYMMGATNPPGDDASNTGNVWIACTHTDTRGTVWTSY